MVCVDVPIERHWLCRLLADEVYKNLSSKQYTGVLTDDSFYTGYLGEQGVFLFLKANGKRCEYRPRVDGRPDDCDLLVYHNGKPIKADVKTAGETFHKYLAIPSLQLKRHGNKLFIGTRLDGPEVEVFGYCWANDLYPGLVDKAHACPLDDLKPLDKLLANLDDGEASEVYPKKVVDNAFGLVLI